jgi:hypothetical protein
MTSCHQSRWCESYVHAAVRGRLGPRRVAAATAVALAAVGCSSISSLGQGQNKISPHVEYWQVEPSGHVEITKASAPGTATSASVKDDLNLDHDRDLLAGLDLDLGKHRLFVDYLRLKFSGSGPASSTFVYHGSTYSAGDVVSSDLELPTWHAGYDYAFWKNESTADALRLGVGAYLWTFDANVKDRTAGFGEQRSFSHVYPSAQAQLVFDLTKHWTADFDGALAYLASDRKIEDLSAALGYDATDRAHLQVGYRRTTLDFHESTNRAKLEFSGPFVGLSIRF